jgi:hypothetical protein
MLALWDTSKHESYRINGAHIIVSSYHKVLTKLKQMDMEQLQVLAAELVAAGVFVSSKRIVPPNHRNPTMVRINHLPLVMERHSPAAVETMSTQERAAVRGLLMTPLLLPVEPRAGCEAHRARTLRLTVGVMLPDRVRS